MQRRMHNIENNQQALQSKGKTRLENSKIKRSLPSIPDSRNKFGISDTEQFIGDYIHKSEEDLRREKEIMKCYRQTLREQYNHLKSPRASNKHKLLSSPNQILKMVKSLQLEQSFEKQKQYKIRSSNKKVLKTIKSKLKSSKPSYINYQSIQSYRLDQNLKEFDKKQEKSYKFQFFNSSEQRFKEIIQKENKEKGRKTVAEYLQMMKRVKQKGGEACMETYPRIV